MSSGDGLDELLDLDDDAALLVDSLTPPEATRLAGLLEQARSAARTELDAAVDAMMSGVPQVARGRVRAMLRGSR